MRKRIHELLTEVVAAKPDALAMIDHCDQPWLWQDLANMTRDALHQLKTFGLGPGNRIVLVFENSPAVIAFLFAASQLDAIVVPVNARLTHTELKRIFEHSDPSVVMFNSGTSSTAKAHGRKFNATKVTGAFGEVDLIKRSASPSETVFEDAAEQVAVMMYTSGTTGSPKAAMLTHGNLLAGALSSSTIREMQATDMCFLALPLSHIYGLVMLMASTRVQCSFRLETTFSVERLYRALLTDVTVLPGVPQMHAHLFHYAQQNKLPKYDRGLLRRVSSGGAPMDPIWKRQAEAFYGLPLQNGYGLTEAAAGVCATSNQQPNSDISVGYAMLNCLLKLDLDAPGSEPDEGIGEVLVGGPQVMKGYFRDKQQTEQVLSADGFYRTGDLGRFDEEARLHIVGRTKELIIRSGFNVYPIEVEATLTEHPEVIVAGVVGRSIDGNEEVLGFVKVDLNSNLTENEIKDFVAAKLAPYKRPSHIIVATELPTAPTGKVLKSKLLETFAAKLS
ncbi:MAG: acyl-CoA synthetase (AMP-forming)/AMP-acid ligase II [Parasphingorhabdus sp.]